MTIAMAALVLSDSLGATGPIVVVASSGQLLPDGSTLRIDPAASGGTLNAAGQVAFYSSVAGSTRNQGIFVADGQGIKTIARGCGAGGGSGDTCTVGDPSPIGGTFAGLFSLSEYAPAINVSGDVLFLADVQGGSSRRGLFLYRSETADIVKVAALGDPFPGGGTIDQIGTGSLNDRGEVAFTAEANTTFASILWWQRGKTRSIVKPGDPAPGGGNFDNPVEGTLQFPDGTWVPFAAPDINNRGQIAFSSSLMNSAAAWGIFVTTPGGTPKTYVRRGDPSPNGTFDELGFPTLNDAGQIAFFASEVLPGGGGNAGLFVGKPGNWRTALLGSTSIDGFPIESMAGIQNPQQALDQDGRLLEWVTVIDGSGQERDRLVLVAADGTTTIVARYGDPAPLGGTYGSLNISPSLVAGRGLIMSDVDGGPRVYAVIDLSN